MAPWSESIDVNVVPLNLVITHFRSLTFKTLQSDFFFFLLHMQLHLRHHPLHSYFFLLCRILFFRFLKWSQLAFDFVHRNVISRHSFTKSVSLLFYFFETNLVIFQISCLWFFKSLISPKHFSINSCCFINSFSLPLDKILSFSFSANVNVLILSASFFSVSC